MPISNENRVNGYIKACAAAYNRRFYDKTPLMVVPGKSYPIPEAANSPVEPMSYEVPAEDVLIKIVETNESGIPVDELCTCHHHHHHHGECTCGENHGECACHKKPKFKKNLAASVLALIFGVVALGFMALSYLGVAPAITFFFKDVGSAECIAKTTDVLMKGAGTGIVDILEACVYCLTIIITLVGIIFSISAICTRKVLLAQGGLYLFALVLWVVLGAFPIIAGEVSNASLVTYVNPLDASIGLQWGFYIFFALMFMATVSGFCNKKKNK